MNYFEMKASLSARGYSYATQEQLGRWINRARAKVDNLYRWPYRLAIVANNAPLTITDLGLVRTVIALDADDAVLVESTRDDLRDWYVDLSTTGTPVFWYRDDLAVSTYPAYTGDIQVRYWRRTPDLTETAEPLSPADYHLLIVSIAQQMAEQDRGNFEAANAMQPDIDRQIAQMVDDLLPQSESQHQRLTYSSQDW